MNTPRRTIPGFTIIELIVAVAVSSIMLFLISVLFSSASDAVSMGMATSDIIGNARATGDQIERDANTMSGPGNGQNGFIVIINKNLSGIPYHEPHLVENPRKLRSDQLVFIVNYNGKPAQPVCASASTTYNPPTKAQMAQATHARIWYGHVLKTDGLSTNAPGAIGAAGNNRVANQLALGRQALFLLDRTYDVNSGAPNAPLAINMSTGAWFDANVTGTVGNGRPLFQGTTDVADWAYQNVKHPVGALFGDYPATSLGSAANHPKTLWNYDSLGGSPLSAANYQGRALQYTYATQSLWANSQPGSPLVTDKSKWYPSDQISQMHPILADSLSDFIVEFAGDYVDNGLNPVAGNPDGVPDVDGSGEILWYGMSNALPGGPPPWLAVNAHEWPIQTTAGGGTAYVFRHDVLEQWPYLIRIRYRMHDRRGDLLGSRSPEDELGGGVGTNVGKWFEQIIVIPR
ncbi:MAG: prepilin-type N-terminal cleavage/methylation domain-containing protein [Phycisphaeraceae bacterium]